MPEIATLTIVLEPKGQPTIMTRAQLENDVELRLLTDLSVAELTTLGFVEGTYRVIPAPPVKTGARKLSKSNDEEWWKIEALKQEALYVPFKTLLWVDEEIDSRSLNALDNWLDPIGVLEEDRTYTTELPEKFQE